MCVFKTIASIMLLVLAAALHAHPQNSGASAGSIPAGNGNSLIEIQKKG